MKKINIIEKKSMCFFFARQIIANHLLSYINTDNKKQNIAQNKNVYSENWNKIHNFNCSYTYIDSVIYIIKVRNTVAANAYNNLY